MKKLLTMLAMLILLVASAQAQECNDGIDNDGDGLTDWVYDLACTDSTDATEAGVSGTIENGWTIYEPAGDTKIYYVSDSDGNDANDGLSPQTPYKTFAAAFNQARQGFSDWILLKRGDTFYEGMDVRYGRLKSEPFLISSYGTSTARPVMKIGANLSIAHQNHFQFVSIIGIDFYAHTRNPNDPEYVNLNSAGGFQFYRSANKPGNDVLIENCSFRYTKGGWFQGAARPWNISVRRNVFEYTFSNDSHASALFSTQIDSVLIEENIMHHNGWLIQADGNGNDQGQATIFNHNTYMGEMTNLRYRGNALIQGSSIGSKFTSSYAGAASDYIIDDNLYLDNEIGISIGSNYTGPGRYKDIQFTNNVLTNMGNVRQTNRGLGWYMQIDDWDTGLIENNYFLNNPDLTVGNTYGIDIDGGTNDVTILDNVFHGIYSFNEIINLRSNSTKQNITFTGNKFMSPKFGAVLIRGAEASTSNYTFTNNEYFSSAASTSWFNLGGTQMDYNGWVNQSGETGGTNGLTQFCDTTRNIATYQASIGRHAAIDSFIVEIKKQGKHTWRTEYDVHVVNAWIRAGFADCASTAIEENNGEMPNFGFDVYPNPTSDLIKVSNRSADQLSVVIYDLAGRRIDHFILNQGQEKQVSLKDFANGLYLVQFDDGASIQTRKVIKN